MLTRLMEALRSLARAGHYTSPDRILAAGEPAMPAPALYWTREPDEWVDSILCPRCGRVIRAPSPPTDGGETPCHWSKP